MERETQHPIRQKLRSHARRIYEAAISAVSPQQAIRTHLRREDRLLRIGNAQFDLTSGRVYVIAFGKAATPMAAALADMLDEYLHAGIVITKYGHASSTRIPNVEIFEAGHPIPDEAGLEATRSVLELAGRAGRHDLVLVAISGGGSALLVHPQKGLSLSDKQQVTQLLLTSGATIEEINTVRKHLSAVKGGRLAEAIFPAQSWSLILSDVIGDPLEFIASGPTTPDSTTYKDAWNIVEKYGLADRLPAVVRDHLQAGVNGRVAETPKPGHAVFDKTRHVLVGNVYQALEAARQEAASLGYNTLVLTGRIQGEAREIAQLYPALADDILQARGPVASPACILAGGEPTVTVKGTGRGGRNQELVLAALPHLAGRCASVLVSIGTDGTDGPTDAAGAIIDDESAEKARRLGLDWHNYLENNDSYAFFSKTGDLIKTGPTQTNVMDLHILLVEKC